MQRLSDTWSCRDPSTQYCAAMRYCYWRRGLTCWGSDVEQLCSLHTRLTRTNIAVCIMQQRLTCWIANVFRLWACSWNRTTDNGLILKRCEKQFYRNWNWSFFGNWTETGSISIITLLTDCRLLSPIPANFCRFLAPLVFPEVLDLVPLNTLPLGLPRTPQISFQLTIFSVTCLLMTPSHTTTVQFQTSLFSFFAPMNPSVTSPYNPMSLIIWRSGVAQNVYALLYTFGHDNGIIVH